jgi:hypothetical protein
MDEIDFDALAGMVEASDLEASVNVGMSETELAEKILLEAAPAAAQSVVKMAVSDPNSRVRLSAAQYILDRTIGKNGDGPTKSNPWDGLFDEVAAVH